MGEEGFQLAGKENYSKVVINKPLCVPLLAQWDQRPAEGSPDLTAWRERQEAERERIRKLDHTPLPPERPPKKLHLLRKVEEDERSSKVARRIELFTPKPFSLTSEAQDRVKPAQLGLPVGDQHTQGPGPQTRRQEPSTQIDVHRTSIPWRFQGSRPAGAKVKPVVPPKPKLCSRSGKWEYGTDSKVEDSKEGKMEESKIEECSIEDSKDSKIEDSRVEDSKDSKEGTGKIEDSREEQTGKIEDRQQQSKTETTFAARELLTGRLDGDLSLELEDHLEGRQGRGEEKRSLERRREELLMRMRQKVELLREDEQEVEVDLREVREEGGRLVVRVEERGTLAEGDKVRVHLQEVERLAILLRALQGRLDRTHKLIHRTRDTDQQDFLEKKKLRLEGQLAEALHLKQFRDRRGQQVLDIIQSLCSPEEVEVWQCHLVRLERLVSLHREVGEKLVLGREQIEALDRASS